MPINKIIIFFIILLPAYSIGQNDYVVLKELNPKTQKKFKKAEKFSNAKNYNEAHQILDKLIIQEPKFVDAFLKKGAIYMEQMDTLNAIDQLENALRIAPIYRINTYHFVARLYYNLGAYEKAALHQSDYIRALQKKGKEIEDAKFELACYEFAANAVKNPVDFNPKSMSNAINTDTCAEYLPSFSADELKMIFTRRNRNLENLFVSRRNSVEENWSTAELFPYFNTAANEGAFHMSADGKTIIFTRCGPNPALNSYNSCDLYESTLINGSWTVPKSLKAINTYAWESQPCISENGQTLVFSSNRAGGYGKNDIYISHKDDKGFWTTPENMGPMINSKGNEASPFFHADGSSLYFMSDGHVGMGNYDLFISRKENGSWLAPINFGYPINTSEQEGAIVVSLDGSTAFFARDNLNADIFRFDLNKDLRPKPVSYIKGSVKDKLTGKPLASAIEIKNVEEGEPLFIRTDESGKFLITLPTNCSYSFVVEKENYLFYSEHFEFVDERSIYEPIYLEIELDSIKLIKNERASEETILNNVFFQSGSAKLMEQSYSELLKLYSLLSKNPTLNIEIQGHTDNVGKDDDNIILSEARAKAVYEYLLSKGIDQQRIRYRGYGEKKPIGNNESEKGRAQNRRTSFIVIGRS